MNYNLKVTGNILYARLIKHIDSCVLTKREMIFEFVKDKEQQRLSYC